ncbi:MAG: signal peptidase II [Lachnospiraceae bacterium]|nr:signal peptidase II [Lachnospiraceae bacterium]
MKKRTSLFGVLAPFIGASGIALTDMYIKEKMDSSLPGEEDNEVKRGILRFRKHHNRGAMLNLGQKYPQEVKGLSIGATGITFLLLAFSAGKRGRILEKTGLACILGGAMSNTYDRVKKGYVMDYASLDVKPQKVRNLIFNLSDVFIGIGLIFVIISNLTAKDRAL